MESSVTSSSSAFKLLLGTLLAIFLLKLFQTLYQHFFYWKNRGIPHINGPPIVGTAWRMFFRINTVMEYANYLYEHPPKSGYLGIMDVMTPALMVRDPEMIKEITVKNFDNFTDHRSIVDESIDPIFGKNVFSLRGDRWKEMRTTLSPSFTASKMRFMYELVSTCCKDFVDYLVEHPEYSAVVEGKDLFTRYTTDIIATSAFGISVNSLKDRKNEFFVRGTDVSRFSGVGQFLKFLLFRLSPRASKLLGLTFLSKEGQHFFRSIVTETLAMREKEKIVRPDMIHLLMQARDRAVEHRMTTDDIVAQAFIFFLAGFDTSSSLMCHLFHELAVNQDVQDKVRKEMEQHMGDNGEVSYDELSKMEYMDTVISETLRKYPPVIFMDRACVKEFEMPPAQPGSKGCIIEPGASIWIPTYSIHHDPKYFPEPEKFDPDRFSEENKDNIVPYTYMPFGLGPRKCIGNRFALMETKILLVHLLHRFNINRSEKTVHPIVFDRKEFSLRAKDGYWIALEKRAVS